MDFKIEESSNYQAIYNETKDEFYLLADDGIQEVPIDLYIPRKTQNIKIVHYDNTQNILDEETISKDSEVLLPVNDNEYYILYANYEDGTNKSLKMTIYNKGKVDFESQ